MKWMTMNEVTMFEIRIQRRQELPVRTTNASCIDIEAILERGHYSIKNQLHFSMFM